MRGKEDRNKKDKEYEENRRQKSEENQVKENEDRFRDLEICEALVHFVLTFGMGQINNLKVKEVRVLL